MHDAPSTCPYLEGQTARLPLRLPIRALRRSEFDRRLSQGDRRQGLLLYRTKCPSCNACEPIRLDIGRFEPGRSQRRVFRNGEAELVTELGPLEPSQEKVRLYNRHKHGRNLSAGEDAIDYDGYRAFLGESCCDSFEIRYRHQGKLIGVAITDRSANALSAVYCYFDPDYGHLSPGTYSILKQVELARRWRLQWVYLGLYIANCEAMAYKGRFLPHDRHREGGWIEFER